MQIFQGTPAQHAAIKSYCPETTDQDLAEAVAFGGEELRDDIRCFGPSRQRLIADADLCIEAEAGYTCWHHYFRGDELLESFSV